MTDPGKIDGDRTEAHRQEFRDATRNEPQADTEDRRLVGRLGALPREIEPSRDLWHGIEARIETGSRPHTRTGARRAIHWGVWSGLAAAAVLVIFALPMARTWLTGSQGPSVPDDLAASPDTPGSPEPLTTLAWQARQEDDVFVTRQALEMALGTARETGRLPAGAIDDLETGLRHLDLAIGETRQALADDPANPRLRLLLAHRYQQEAALLRRVRSL